MVHVAHNHKIIIYTKFIKKTSNSNLTSLWTEIMILFLVGHVPDQAKKKSL